MFESKPTCIALVLTSDIVEEARNLTKHQNMPLSISHYLRNMSKLANQWTRDNYKEQDRQRIYLKDIDCPDLWRQKLEEELPPGIFYLNENTGDLGGPGADHVSSRGAARAGDLMSCLPPEMRAENLMCYIGHEGTYTPAHREMCASLGQNLMVETSGLIDEEGKPAKPGSSIWFMTESKDRHLVSEFWLSTLGHDIEIEKHFAQINALKAAPFKVYIVEQRVGDFILIPPLAPHQVWNRGTRTMKVAWNRTTVETLELALHEALPRARMVCRDEQYKNKAIIYFTLEKYFAVLKQVEFKITMARNPQERESLRHCTKIRQLQKDFKRLYALFTEVLLSEMLSPVSAHEKKGQYIPYDSFITCSYCRCNIFNRFLTCTSCIDLLPNGDEDTYDICLDCFAMGRSCACISGYKWVEQFPWQDLVEKHELWRQQIMSFEGGSSEKIPKPLQVERKSLKKKTLAQVCQEQLKLRPWSDPKNPRTVPGALQGGKQRQGSAEAENEEEPEGKSSSKKKLAPRKQRLDKNFCIEHVSLYPREKWKVALCSKCERAYDYGSLWRMFDMMPLTVMEDPHWECPFCLRICSCGSCRRRVGIQPYEPKGTVLGHDTKKIADPRSSEHLVDFSHSNMNWIKTAGDDQAFETRRLTRRIEEAERAKASDPELDDHYVDTESAIPQRDHGVTNEISEPGIPIDPMLSEVSQTGISGADLVRPSMARPTTSDNPRLSSNEQTLRLPEETISGYRGESNDVIPQGHSDAVSRIDRSRHFVSNGIAFEYPDPEELLPVNPAPVRAQTLPQTRPGAKEVGRKSSAFILQSDVVSGPEDDKNEQFRRAQIQQALREAELNNRHIIAEAALTGKSLKISLRISSTKLASLNQPTILTSDPTANLSATRNDLVQSDLPTAATLEQGKNVVKKRKNREDDDEFQIRKRRDRVSTITDTPKGDKVKAQSNIAEGESESETEQPDRPFEVSAAKKTQGPRPLPKYLASRSQDQDEDMGDTITLEPQQQSTSISNNNVSTRSPAAISAPAQGKRSPATALVSKTIPTPNPRSNRENHVQARPSKESIMKAQRLAEENRLAKMKAVSWANDNDRETESSDRTTPPSDDKPTPPPPPKASKTHEIPQSIFSRKGVAGRKIKIASMKTAAAAGKKQRLVREACLSLRFPTALQSPEK